MGQKQSPSLQRELKRRIAAAQGQLECDGVLRGVRYLDVFSCEWQTGDIAWIDGTIVGVDSGLKAKREWNGKGKFLVPGFVDAHVHVESSMMVPELFESVVLPRGTTTAMCDPHELANVMGKAGIEYFLKASARMHMDLWVMVSSCVPATDFETNGGGHLKAKDLAPFRKNPRAWGLAEMMNVPGVLTAQPEIVDKLVDFDGRPLDGHCPLLSGNALSAYASAGISSCHESTRLDEAREKLIKGIAVWIREGSVTKDLNALLPLLTAESSARIGFCTDDRNPRDIAREGHLDFLVRESIRKGTKPEWVFRSASWSVAQHYRLPRVGAIAPGYKADFVLLQDVETCALGEVWKGGSAVSEMEWSSPGKKKFPNSIRAALPTPEGLEGPKGRVHVIGLRDHQILTDHFVRPHSDRGVSKLTVLERYGKKSRPANGYVYGFGEGLNGAIASSVGHDSHNLITVGSNTRDMQVALKAVAGAGGGFCVVRDGAVQSQLALPFGGLMSAENAATLGKGLGQLVEASQSIGCGLSEPFLTLAFLSLPVIPSLKLTDKGLVDVDEFKMISVAAP